MSADAKGSPVTESDVRHVASLARLGVTDEQVRALTLDMNSILEHMNVLGRVDTSRVEETSGAGLTGMRLRQDEGPAIPLEKPVESFAPETRDGLFLVPRLSTHETTES